MLANNINDLIGNTPLYELKNIEKLYNLKSKLYAKLEYFNLTGSIKDRAAYNMIIKALEDGKIKEGATLIEPTSGNTGIGISAIGASMGFKVIIVMPDSMSQERQKLIKAYGAEIILTPGKLGMKGSIDKANELNKEIDNSMILAQFDNPNNKLAHLNTAKEIYEDLNGKIDAIISPIGTGGTISGIALFMHQKNKDIKMIGVEPEESPLLSEGYSGPHKIQGIGANFIPSILDLNEVDQVIKVKGDDAINMAKTLAKVEGLLVGISSGSSLKAAIEYAKYNENKNIVLICPDSGDRYLSIF